jgi:hypothetical protein
VSSHYFFEKADALLGRFVPEVCVDGFCYFGDASSSSLLILLNNFNFGFPRPPPPPPSYYVFFTYLGCFDYATAAFKFRLLDRL